ncbi:MAG: signal peptidase II [Eubacteriaceae bacterium]|jgi:lipoprotein signal peptidase|nr:signal peptidase II [Eubacteriaceae bacterium]
MKYMYAVLICVIPSFVIGVDQYMKHIAIKKWESFEADEQNKRFSWRPIKNTGGFLGFGKERSKGVFIALFVLAFLLIAWMITVETMTAGIGSPQIYLLIALLSGGISNTVDRIRYGGVIDYWQIAIGKKRIVINFADVMIFASGIAYLLLSLLSN